MECPVSVAEELWDQLVYLSDPSTDWVRGMPLTGYPQACLVARGGRHVVGPSAHRLLLDLTVVEGRGTRGHESAAWWNDHNAKSREQVIHVLEEAYWWAKEEGL